jgi:nicotinate dehydrogenase subunit B
MKKDPLLERDFRDVHTPYDMDRRNFLKRIGGGLIITFSLKDYGLLYGMEPPQRQEADLNAYLRIGGDGRVSCLTGKIEMGQGVITSLALMLADELDVNPGRIDMIMGDTDLCPWDAGTYGSMTTRFFGPLLRAAGAQARAILLQLAAEQLGTRVEQLAVKDGVIFPRDNPRKKVSYAELTGGKEIVRELDHKADLKQPSEFQFMNRPVLRRDAVEKVTGAAKYAGDVRLPGMLYARILRPPSHASKLINADTSEAEKMDGVEVVRDGDLVAVLHAKPDIAELALSKIRADFETPESTLNEKNIFEHLVKSAEGGRPVDSGGNLETGRQLSRTIFKKEYLDGYKAHAPIENHTATAVMENGIMKVWASTQTPFRAKENIAEILDIPQEKVHVMQIFVGGGFGGKTSNQQAHEAARLAKLTGKPVQVAWTRQEEFFYDHFRPAAVVRITSGITGEGDISLWDYEVMFAGERGSAQFYDIPNHRTVSSGSGRGGPSVHPFYTGAWRAPANNTNTFARESQVDIMAAAAGVDPVEFRLRHLKNNEKMAGVLKAAADKFDWKPAAGPSRRGYGVACGTDAGTLVASMAEVEVDEKNGHVQVKRVTCAQNMGLSINPQGATIQVEGCIIMGMGYALAEDVRFEGGKVLTRNFDTYEFTHFSWVPEIDVVIIDAQDDPPQGGGEPAIICMGAVIANAIFDACGARLYQLPMIPERVLAAIPGK